MPGYSLADELERLMIAAEEPAPLLTPAEHDAVVTSPQPIVADEPLPPADGLLYPQPSVGQVLSAPVPSAVPRADGPASAPAPTVAPPGEPLANAAPVAPPAPVPAPARQGPDVPDYALVSPVELHFTGGAGRIGVKPGTRSYIEFQRLAGILLKDLREARGW